MITCYFENENKALLRHAVVDVLVLIDNKILLVKRNKQLSEGGKWALPGGYVDRDETLKDAVKRETFEETGYRIKDLTLLRIKDTPNRPHEDKQNIAFVFLCTALEKEGNSDWEVDEQKWFGMESLPDEEEVAFDHYNDIKLYLEYKENKTKIPILE